MPDVRRAGLPRRPLPRGARRARPHGQAGHGLRGAAEASGWRTALHPHAASSAPGLATVRSCPPPGCRQKPTLGRQRIAWVVVGVSWLTYLVMQVTGFDGPLRTAGQGHAHGHPAGLGPGRPGTPGTAVAGRRPGLRRPRRRAARRRVRGRHGRVPADADLLHRRIPAAGRVDGAAGHAGRSAVAYLSWAWAPTWRWVPTWVACHPGPRLQHRHPVHGRPCLRS